MGEVVLLRLVYDNVVQAEDNILGAFFLEFIMDGTGTDSLSHKITTSLFGWSKNVMVVDKLNKTKNSQI